MEHPNAIGDRSQLAIMLALQEAGHTIFLPFGENSRCDLAIDIGDRLVRVHCKTGRLRQGAVRFAARYEIGLVAVSATEALAASAGGSAPCA
jgi:hypothetical protein